MARTNSFSAAALMATAVVLAACGDAGEAASPGSDNSSKSASTAEPPRSSSQIAEPGTGGAIAVEIAAETQFDTGCMLDPTLINPSGEQFTLLADIGGTRHGDPIAPIRKIEDALTMQITGYSDAGRQLGPTAILGRCEDLDLVIGNVRCREGAGIEGSIGPCPAPVSFQGSDNISSLKVR